MYRICLLSFLLLLLGQSISAQPINFEDGFEDGNFTENPSWNGNIDSFAVVDRDANFLLQLSAESSGSSYLSTPSSSVTGSWEFYILFDGFEPSGSNQAEIFLMSDRADLNGSVNGYALKVGESGADRFHIVRYDTGIESETLLSDTTVVDSNGGGYRIKVNRDSEGNWTLAVGTGYEGKLYDSGKTAQDNIYSTSSYFGVKTTYTASRADKFYFDFKIDLPPFQAISLTAQEQSLLLTFNRPYDPLSIQSTDFRINDGVGYPASVQFSDASTLLLRFSEPFSSNRYELAIGNILDENGSSITPNTILYFIIYGTMATNDILINEFMYDPPAGLPEYVEIRNVSTKYANLQDWLIGDQNGQGLIISEPFSLAADTLLVLSPDTLALFERFGDRNYLEVSSSNFPSFNNSGDAVQLVSSNGIIIDSLSYKPDWGGEDIALERRSSKAPSHYAANWGDAPNGLGTPGLPNEIAADQSPPDFLELNILNATTLELSFSEVIDPILSGRLENFTINDGPTISLVTTQLHTATLTLTSSLQSGRRYRLSFTNVADLFGNKLTDQTIDFTFYDFAKPMYGDIVINEILYQRPEAGSAEFIELFNRTGKNFDLSGWVIRDTAGSSKLEDGTILLPGSYLVLTGSESFANSVKDAQYLTDFPVLNDSEEQLALYSGDGLLIDSLGYSDEWRNVIKDGQSLERKDPGAASNDPANWTASQAAIGHTAGKVNNTYEPDNQPPDMIMAKQQTDATIEVLFNEFITIGSSTAFYAGGLQLEILAYDSLQANSLILKVPNAKFRQKIDQITAQDISDLRGNLSESISIPLSQPLKPSDVVINEIMFDPIDNSDDGLPNQSEYIELRNIRNYAVSLEGVFLSDAPDEDGITRDQLPFSSYASWLPSNGVLLIYADEEPEFKNSKLARFFDLDATLKIPPLRIDRSSLSLNADNDFIFLRDSTGQTIDSVHYEQSWHNPNLLDTKGIALERIRPPGLSNDPGNWGSSTTPKGGTPGSENTLFQAEVVPSENTGITFSSNPFSPDGDGRDDNLVIRYQLQETDYLLRVRVYDRYGRLVRTLADGRPSGFEGALIWDGQKDNGSSNRIGIYIIVFEAYNSSAGRERAFKETVVLARKLH